MSADNNSIVPAPTASPPASALAVNASPMQLVLDQLRVMWSNVPLESPEAQALLSAVVADVSIKEDERLGQVFGVVAALIQHPQEHTDDKGEVWTAPAVTLLTDTGETLRWFSAGVANCLAVLTMNRPSGKWSPPVYLRCVGIKTAKGHRRMTLQAVQTPAIITEPKGGKRG